MTLKIKNRCDDVDDYRSIAHTGVFREVLEKNITIRLQAFREGLVIAQDGFRKGKSAYDLISTFNVIIMDRYRKRRLSWGTFLDISGAIARSTEAYSGKGAIKWLPKGIY